jgi:hypothetical protein
VAKPSFFFQGDGRHGGEAVPVAGTAGLHCWPDLNDGSCSRRRRCRRSSFQRYSDGSAGSSSVEQPDDCRTGTPRSQRRPAATLLRVWLGDPGAENDPLFLGFVSFCLSRACLDKLLSLFNGTFKFFKMRCVRFGRRTRLHRRNALRSGQLWTGAFPVQHCV